MLGNEEMLLVLLLAYMLFGPDRLPQLARQLGEAVKKLRDAFDGKELKG